MKNCAMRLKIIVTSFFIILLSSVCMADERIKLTTLADSFVLIESESEGISDDGLLLIRGLGDNGAPIVIPGPLSIILWDESGSSNTKTRHEKSIGSSNSQNMNLILINTNVTR